jgi:hypothetical protein
VVVVVVQEMGEVAVQGVIALQQGWQFLLAVLLL